MTQETKRIDWIDVARGLALIFVYLGHWITARVEVLAYGFHLQLFFIISGFFIIRDGEKAWEFAKKKICTIAIPLFLWACISFIINRFDAESFSGSELSVLFLDPASVQPNYWFLPALLAVSLIYIYIYKFICKDKLILLLVFWALHMLCGEAPIIADENNIFIILSQLPVLKTINAWIAFKSVPQFLFYYALGAAVFPGLRRYESWRREKPAAFHALGLANCGVSAVLFLYQITGINRIAGFIYSSTAVFECYKIITTLCICFCAVYLSMLMERSSFLKEVGSNSMSLVGLEYITHSYLTLSLLPMLNLGIPNMVSTVDVMTITLATLWINCRLARGINKYFPVLNGKWKGPTRRKKT